MPGIVGIFSKRPRPQYEEYVRAMIRSMLHEPSYRSGFHFVPHLGVYAGWVADENSFAAGQVFFNEAEDRALVAASPFETPE